MKRALLCAGVAMVFLVNAACHEIVDVDIIDFRYIPGSATVGLAGDIDFTNDGSENHTATSDQGFFDTGTMLSGDSADIQFNHAGKFPYHCTFHPKMKGTIEVPVGVSEPEVSKGGSVTIFWESSDFFDGDDEPEIPAGFDADVQVKLPGSTKWKTIFENQTGTSVSGSYATTKKGVYRFRARYQETSSGDASGYSPPVPVEAT